VLSYTSRPASDSVTRRLLLRPTPRCSPQRPGSARSQRLTSAPAHQAEPPGPGTRAQAFRGLTYPPPKPVVALKGSRLLRFHDQHAHGSAPSGRPGPIHPPTAVAQAARCPTRSLPAGPRSLVTSACIAYTPTASTPSSSEVIMLPPRRPTAPPTPLYSQQTVERCTAKTAPPSGNVPSAPHHRRRCKGRGNPASSAPRPARLNSRPLPPCPTRVPANGWWRALCSPTLDAWLHAVDECPACSWRYAHPRRRQVPRRYRSRPRSPSGSVLSGSPSDSPVRRRIGGPLDVADLHSQPPI